jgi:hypothetical protein
MPTLAPAVAASTPRIKLVYSQETFTNIPLPENVAAYTSEDVRALLDGNFDDGVLICRLFLGISKDQLVSVFRGIRGEAGIGVKSYRADRDAFLEDVLSTGLLEAMAEETNRKPHWSNVLVERGSNRRSVADFRSVIAIAVLLLWSLD